MGCPVNTVKTRMFHARKRLAKLLPVLQEHNASELDLMDLEEKEREIASPRRDDQGYERNT
jgi:hypothetical protein